MIAPQYHDVGRTIENFLEQNGSEPSEPVPPRGMRVTGNTRRNSECSARSSCGHFAVLSSYPDPEIRAPAEHSNIAVTSVDLHVVIDEREVVGSYSQHLAEHSASRPSLTARMPAGLLKKGLCGFPC
jgi:hypothetical protein